MAKRFFNWLLRIAYRLVLRLEVEGVENIPAEGPVILMINHVNFLDPFVMAASLPRQVTALSKVENFSLPVFGLVFRLYGAIPVHRGQVDRRALRWAQRELKQGTLLLIAPEGTRSPDHELQPAHKGLAFIALRSDAAVVPAAIIGTPAFIGNLKRLRRAPVRIRLGRPFRFRGDRHALDEMTDEAMYQLAGLLPPAYRGVYADLTRATEDHIEFVDHHGEGGRIAQPSDEAAERER
jgi:1-acyl-sn-glycerol-3-phosphate acyltransferase